MKLTKRQKALAGLCVLGVAFFAYDRFGSSVKPAAASPLPADSAAPCVADAAAAETPGADHSGGGSSRQAIANRLQSLMAGQFPQADDIRNAFCSPALAVKPVPAPVAVGPAPAPEITAFKARKDVFAESHKLRAVMVGSAGRVALMRRYVP